MCETPELRETVISNGLNSFMIQANEDEYYKVDDAQDQIYEQEQEYDEDTPSRQLSDNYSVVVQDVEDVDALRCPRDYQNENSFQIGNRGSVNEEYHDDHHSQEDANQQ